MVAASNGHESTVELLLDRGADVTATNAVSCRWIRFGALFASGKQASGSGSVWSRTACGVVWLMGASSFALSDALLACAEPWSWCSQDGETALCVAANASVLKVLEQADCLQRWHRRAILALWRRACGWK